MSMFKDYLTQERIQAARQDCETWRLARQGENNYPGRLETQVHQLLGDAKKFLAAAKATWRLGKEKETGDLNPSAASRGS